MKVNKKKGKYILIIAIFTFVLFLVLIADFGNFQSGKEARRGTNDGIILTFFSIMNSYNDYNIETPNNFELPNTLESLIEGASFSGEEINKIIDGREVVYNKNGFKDINGNIWFILVKDPEFPKELFVSNLEHTSCINIDDLAERDLAAE